VMERPNDEPAAASTVSPGQHAMTGGYAVVWWDPGALRLGATPPFGVRRDDLIVKDVTRNVIADGRSRYDLWRLARLDARAAGSEPSLRVATVRDWTSNASNEVPSQARAIDVTVVGRRRASADHAGGAAFGALVHAVLAQAPFEATPDLIAAIAKTEARALALDDESATAAAATVERVFRHELLERARAAAGRNACRRETPVACRLPDGTMVEGVVDLAFEEKGVWTVVDYKTDREIEAAGEDRYRRQVALYASAIAQATGKAATGVLLRI